MLEWFGYKLHVLCDTRHEVALAYRITPASEADNEHLGPLVQEAKANVPEKRIESLAYDKGRSAVERVNARLKVFWGVDDSNVAGGASFHANVGVVMVVHIGLATLLAKAPRRDPKRRLGQTRLSPVARALHGT